MNIRFQNIPTAFERERSSSHPPLEAYSFRWHRAFFGTPDYIAVVLRLLPHYEQLDVGLGLRLLCLDFLSFLGLRFGSRD